MPWRGHQSAPGLFEMNEQQTDAKTNGIESKAIEAPAGTSGAHCDKMVRRESVERKRASTADILGGKRLNPQNSPDYRHD